MPFQEFHLQETGTAKIERTKEGDLWKTVISTVSTNNPAVKLIHIFEATLKSDHKTMLQGTYKCEDGHDYTLNVNRVPGESIKAREREMKTKYMLSFKFSRLFRRLAKQPFRKYSPDERFYFKTKRIEYLLISRGEYQG